MEAADVEVRQIDDVLNVVFTRPGKLNAISKTMTAALWEAVVALGDRDDLRCLLISAEGEYFSAGMDIKQGYGNRRGDPTTRHLHPGWNYRRNYRTHHLLYDEMENVEKPIVLAAQGPCLGGALEMATSVDFRFCAPNTYFSLPEVELGVVAGSGGATRLSNLVGPGWAKWISMAGVRVDAEQAKSIGLVHDIFPSETFRDDVLAFCRRLSALPRGAVGLTKLSINLAGDVDRATQRHIDRLVNTELITGDTFNQNISRFRTHKP